MNIRLINLSLILNLSELLILGAGFSIGFLESITTASAMFTAVLITGLVQIILLVINLFRYEETRDNKALSLLSIVISGIVVSAALGLNSML